MNNAKGFVEANATKEIATEGVAEHETMDAESEAKLIEIVSRMNPDDRSKLGRLLGVKPAGMKKRRNPGMNNDQVRRNMLMVGEVSHDDDFVPTPPESIIMKGEAAVQIWQQQWREHHQLTQSGFDANEDVQDLMMEHYGVNTLEDLAIVARGS